MSDNRPGQGSRQLLRTAIFWLVPALLVIFALNYSGAFDKKPAAATVATEKALEARIQKVGSVQIRDAERPLRSGEEVFKAQCAACHSAGLLDSPKFGDAQAWGPRLRSGYRPLLNSALNGKNAMPAQSGGDFQEIEIARAVVYMANAAGGKFDEPKITVPAPAK